MIVYADLRWPANSGIGVVGRELLRRIPSHLEVVDLRVKGSIGSPASPLAISTAMANRRTRTGAFWSPGYMPPAYSRIPSVVYVHDLTHLHFYSRFHVAYYNWVLRRLWRRCTKIVCPSEYTKKEFLEWSGLPSDKVCVIPLAASESFMGAKSESNLPFAYVLYPGNHRSYKNVERLVAAYAQSALPRNNVHLVFTGAAQVGIQTLAGSLGVSERVHFAGRVTDEQLVSLYQGASMVAFVSLYEGFGLPILEAMTAGVPVLTSNAASMPEVAGGAALIVDPYSIDAIANGLDVLTLDDGQRKEHIQLGYARIKSFSWDITARGIWALIGSLTRD